MWRGAKRGEWWTYGSRGTKTQPPLFMRARNYASPTMSVLEFELVRTAWGPIMRKYGETEELDDE